MSDYDSAKGSFWLPFVMDSIKPGITTDALNCSPLGFRYSINRLGKCIAPGDELQGPVSLLVGGSTVFGVGASSDELTVPSLLAKRRDENWFNLGTRGATLAQNLAQFMIFRQLIGPVKDIVILGGWNDVTVFQMAPLFARYYGLFHGFTLYFKTMNRSDVDITKREIIFPEQWSSLIKLSIDKQETRPFFREHMSNVLDNWKFVADGLGARIQFVAQPVSFCCPHDLTEMERQWFATKSNLTSFEQAAQSFREWYLDMLAEECGAVDMPFANSNDAFGEGVEEPLFIDPVHLTDRGNEEMATVIESTFPDSR
tara:strand:- start:304 stop:1242 length:939 start_codon:yes stop_codon:yes gene_type:complete